MYQESDQVKDLKLKYQRSLDEKADVLASYAALLLNDEGEILSVNDELQQELHEQLHKLAGSTGMYGYSKLSQKCRKVMALVQQNKFEKLHENLKKLETKFRKIADVQ